MLLVFGREEDWLLVQSSKKDGKAGFVPANYVEPHDDEEEETQPSQPQIVVPPSVRLFRPQTRINLIPSPASPPCKYIHRPSGSRRFKQGQR